MLCLFPPVKAIVQLWLRQDLVVRSLYPAYLFYTLAVQPIIFIFIIVHKTRIIFPLRGLIPSSNKEEALRSLREINNKAVDRSHRNHLHLHISIHFHFPFSAVTTFDPNPNSIGQKRKRDCWHIAARAKTRPYENKESPDQQFANCSIFLSSITYQILSLPLSPSYLFHLHSILNSLFATSIPDCAFPKCYSLSPRDSVTQWTKPVPFTMPSCHDRA